MRIHPAIAFAFISFGVAIAAERPAPAVAGQQEVAKPQQTPPTPQQPRSLVPDTFTNLQVLPKDIAKSDLVRIMRQFCFTTDQRCSYCHVATDDLSQADFAADDKEPKKKARELLKFIIATQKKPSTTP